MTIAKRVQEANRALFEEDFESGLLPLVTAIDANAGKEFPMEKNQKRIEKWLRKNQGFIT